MKLRRPLIVLCALVAALGLAACGNHHAHLAAQNRGVANVADANNNGGYVFAGPITYQLQISRLLNQYSNEDAQYMKGLPAGTSLTTGPNQMWYGVFLWAKNQTDRRQRTTDNFEIVDTQGTTYRPVKLDPKLNPFVWTSMSLSPGAIQPRAGTIAANGPTQGGLLLFKLNTDVYSNRPLTLYILGANNQKLGSISLDL